MVQKFVKWMISIREISVKRGNLYKKSLTIVLIITCFPAALIGISFYYFGTTQIEDEVMQTHRGQLENARRRIDSQLAHIELMASQWALNPLFDEKLEDMDFYKQFQTTQELFRSLFIIKGSSTLIDEVYLYINGQRLLISEDYGIRRVTEERNDEYKPLLHKNGSMYWTDFSAEKENSALALIYGLAGGGENSYGSIIVTLNETKFNDMVRELAADKEGYSFIIRENGEWITTGIDGLRAGTGGQLFLRDTVLKRNAATDSFIVKWDKENYSVSSGKFSKAGSTWIYVTASPVNQLITPVLLMSRMILFVSGFGLMVAICLSWFGSVRLYRPIHHLQYRVEEQIPKLREGFLLQLVQGHLYSLTEKELRMRMTQFGWNVDKRCFSIMVVQLVGFFKFPGKFLEKDRQLVTFAASNIIEELAGNKMDTAVVINFQDLTIGLLVTFPVEKYWRQFKSELFKLADEITETLNTLLKLNVTICVGKSTDLVSEIPNVLQEVRQTMHYRVVEENNQVLDMDELAPATINPSYYPFPIEKMIHHALRRGDGPDADHLIKQFLADLSDHGVTEFTLLQSALYLLANILQTIVQMGFNPHQLYKGDNLFEQLVSKREQDEIRGWFHDKVLEPFLLEYLENRDSQLKYIVKLAINMIDTGYMHDISLEACAEQLGVHPVRLSKSFKQIVGHTFIDYLTDVRLKKSKELLNDTDWKINDIAKQVGYQPSYFNKIFRRHEGMTASEYRVLCKG